MVACATSEMRLTHTDYWPETDGLVAKQLPYGGSQTRAKVLDDCFEWIEENKVERDIRRRFVQTLALLQRPVLPAVLWSSAFYDGSSGDQTILARERTLKNWLEQLSVKPGLIRFLPGGLLWMQVDHRLLLQKSRKLGAQVASIHAGIAAWYEKSINSTRTPEAVFECAYHYCMAAKAAIAEKGGPEDPTYDASKRPASSYIKAAYSVIFAESFLIQTHGYSKGCCRQLSRISGLASYMYDSKEFSQGSLFTEEEKAEIRGPLTELRIVCAETMRAIAREVGEDGKAFLRHRQVALLKLGVGVPDREPLRPKKEKRDLVGQVWASERFTTIEKWRWLRWTVMLHISTRAYERAEKLLHGPGKLGGEGLLGPLTEQDPSQTERIEYDEEDPKYGIEQLRIIEQGAALQLLRLSPDRRLDSQVPDAVRLRYAEQLVLRGLRLAARIRMSGKLFAGSALMDTNWCEARLLMHQSVVHSHAEISRTRSSLGILSDAEALLRISNPQRITTEIALIDLHRAEVILNSSAFTPAIRIFQRLKTEKRLSAFETRKDKLTLKKTGPVAADAIRFLDRAESELRQMRRNVWWTTWYFERKLRAMAFALLASCAEPHSPIPFVGLEAAVAGKDTVIDALYEDALRMIRVDVYRMATVLDAYALCYTAFEYRLKGMENAKEYGQLDERRRKMWKRRVDGAHRLNQIFKARRDHEDLDPIVANYVERILHEFEPKTYKMSRVSTTPGLLRHRQEVDPDVADIGDTVPPAD